MTLQTTTSTVNTFTRWVYYSTEIISTILLKQITVHVISIQSVHSFFHSVNLHIFFLPKSPTMLLNKHMYSSPFYLFLRITVN